MTDQPQRTEWQYEAAMERLARREEELEEREARMDEIIGAAASLANTLANVDRLLWKHLGEDDFDDPDGDEAIAFQATQTALGRWAQLRGALGL